MTTNAINSSVQTSQKPKKLTYISFLKFVAMALIVMWHVVACPKPFDIGARMCEFLIVASGFLVGYNHYRNQLDSKRNGILKYTYKHLKEFYPLHIICMVLIFFLNFTNNIAKFNLTTIENLFANIFLVQAWAIDQNFVFSFNGISWFLSALIFCYFLSPILLKGIKNLKRSIILFVIVAAIRIWIELAVKMGGDNIFGIFFHANPAIKLLEFFLGMLIVPTFYLLKEKIDKIGNKIFFKIIWTIIELAMPFGMWFFMYYLSGTFIRAYFVLFFCICVFIASMNYGYLSDFFGLKIPARVLGYQMGAFLLHLVVNESLTKIFRWTHITLPSNYLIAFAIKMVFLLIAACIYHEFIAKWLSKLMDIIVHFFKRILFDTKEPVRN